MSSPSSTKLAPPTYVDPRVRRRLYHIYLIKIWISLLPSGFFLYWFYYPGSESYLFHNLWLSAPLWFYFLITPFYITFIYIVTVLWTAIITKIQLLWLNLRHKPKEGVFLRNRKDKDYLYWNKRNLAKIFLFWLLYSTPFTIFKIFLPYRLFGVKVGKNCVLNHAWITPEFVSIGSNVKIGQGACIYSFLFENDKLLVAQVTIGDNVSIGPHSIIYPGTKIENNVIIDAGSYTLPFFELKENKTYKGAPIKNGENLIN